MHRCQKTIEARAHPNAKVSVLAHLTIQMKMILKEFDDHHKLAREKIVSKLQKKVDKKMEEVEQMRLTNTRKEEDTTGPSELKGQWQELHWAQLAGATIELLFISVHLPLQQMQA